MLRPCPVCHRHVEHAAVACAFCAAALSPPAWRESRAIAAGRLGRAAIFAGAVALAPLGCGDPAPRYEALPLAAGSAATTGVVKGRIKRHDGEPAAGAGATLYGDVFRARTGIDALSVQADENGMFELRDIPPDTYRFVVSGRNGSMRITVRAGQAVVIEATQDEPRRLHHSAKPYGAPPARRRVV